MFILNRKNILLVSIFFILIGIFLRFYQLDFENYWFDELIDFWVADPNISSDIEMLQVICYEPVMAYNCNISSDKQKSWTLKNTKKMYLLNVKLCEIKN